jgi:hypothetical protein
LGKGCRHQDRHILHKMLPTPQPKTCRRFEASFTGAALAFLTCTYCEKRIGRSDYYRKRTPAIPLTYLLDCCECDKDDFDVCIDCYNQGRRCHNKDEHPVLVLLHDPRSILENISEELPILSRLHRKSETIYCDRCSSRIDFNRWRFYRTYPCHNCTYKPM